jgi:ferric-dicitrate binding protein FerR (iron transport regulator)
MASQNNNGLNTETLIRKYVENTITLSEMDILYGIFNDPAEEENLQSILRKVWDDIPADVQLRVDHKSLLYTGIITSLAQHEKPAPKTTFIYWRMAAVILVLIVASFLLYQNYFQQLLFKTPVTEIYNPAGKRSKIKLPDGTTVWLNAESKITYPEKFNTSSRNVTLTGEAFFNVVRNENAPFIITTGELQTTVLGTSFNVQSYSGETFRMTVASGKVQVRSKAETIQVNANQQTTYQHHAGFSIPVTIEPADVMAWTHGTLSFNNKTFEEVARMLERWYNVKITFANNDLKKCILVGEHTNQSLDAVLNTLQFMLGFQYENHHGNIIIRGEGC